MLPAPTRQPRSARIIIPRPISFRLVLDAASGVRPAVQVFGTDYATPDGTAIRDYVHVCDLARAHVLALQHLLDGGETFAVNLGSGQGISVREVIDTVRHVTGCEVIGARRATTAGGSLNPGGRSEEIARSSWWSAERSDLATIVADAWRWHDKRFGQGAQQVICKITVLDRPRVARSSSSRIFDGKVNNYLPLLVAGTIAPLMPYQRQCVDPSLKIGGSHSVEQSPYDYPRSQRLSCRFLGRARARRRARRRGRGGALPAHQALGGISVAGDRLLPARGGPQLSDVDHIAINQDSRANLLRKLGYLLTQRPNLSAGARPAQEPAQRARAFRSSWRRAFPGRACAANCTTSSIISRIFRRPFTSRRSRRRSSFRSMASAISPAPPGASGGARSLSVDGRVYFPHSLGIFYQALTQYLGFPHYGDEYKVMGLAPYGQPTYLDAMRKIVRLVPDGTFTLDLSYFRHHEEQICVSMDRRRAGVRRPVLAGAGGAARATPQADRSA